MWEGLGSGVAVVWWGGWWVPQGQQGEGSHRGWVGVKLMTERCSLVFPVWPSTLALNTSSWLRRSALFGGPTWRPWPQTTRFCLLLMHLPRFETRRLFQAAGAANGCAALHQWLPVLRNQYFSAATKLLVLRSRIAPGMTYGIELWRPAKNGANMMAVLTRAAKLISGIHREASHMAFFKDRSVNQDVMLADLDILSAADHCRMTHARRYARRATSAAAAATYVHNDPCSPEFRVALPAAYAPDYMGAAV